MSTYFKKKLCLQMLTVEEGLIVLKDENVSHFYLFQLHVQKSFFKKNYNFHIKATLQTLECSSFLCALC